MQIILMDGSMGQELVRRSGQTPTPLWSTSVMLENPDLVQQVHQEYLQSGATIISTNTYPVLYDRLVKVGLEGQLEELWRVAVSKAKAARTSFGGGRIAGALGPLGASYRPDLAPEPALAAQEYTAIVSFLAQHVDLLMPETVSSIRAAQGVLQATDLADCPVWLAVSVQDFNGLLLRSGEPLEALRPVLDSHRVDAILVNCSRPEDTTKALEVIQDFGLPFGAFANGFSKINPAFLKDSPTVDALEARNDLGPQEYSDFAMAWVKQGATIVGGCCEIGPQHIAHLAQTLRDQGYEIV